MAPMLPAPGSGRMSLTAVLPGCLAALAGEGSEASLPPVDRAVVVLVDGLGSAALRARAGHARNLVRDWRKRDLVDVGFPTTTAASITSFTTGVRAGEHGLVGYSALDPAGDRVLKLLSGWDARSVPEEWQPVPTVFERAAAQGVAAFAVGPARYSGSGFSRAALRGATYVAAESMADRFATTRALLDRTPRALVYLYVPELDQAAHSHGWQSERWLRGLEELDAAFGPFRERLGAREGLLVTADHGIVDVPAESQVLFDRVPELVAGVRHVAGEPRCLHLHLEPGVDADALADAWRASEGSRAHVATREEAVAADWYGGVRDGVAPRIGDVVVAARALIAYYDGRPRDQGARRMVGQHGSFSDEERLVPLIRAGAFARD
ncbi:alkaline phosphatase family protein [Clavibacter michiganensis]|uniref:alkaline phosphatase family protein n=1 Tax=Clavibacter michiganensis TaxID=28447 RepID=UPI001BDFB9A7|nr:alkaline phosphatase family protein [Clavibacter michiganensis]MBT1635967.1 alkaline phosphatase family protein [Clavibacter michiganensis]